MPKIVVIGAGVAGLTSALLLSKRKENVVTVVARHMPGDHDIEYTSPWAGANVLPMASEENSRWERQTWPELKRLAAEVPEAGIHFQKSVIFRREKELNDKSGGGSGGLLSEDLFAEKPWFRTLFDDYREMDAHELPAGVGSAAEFTSVCINTALYLPWLVGQCLARGVVFRRGILGHVSEAAALGQGEGHADVVVNATGLLASRLGGVMDAHVVPARGQIVVVRNEAEPMMTISGTDDGPAELSYIMMRAAGGGTVLGGTYQKGRWDADPDPNTALRIMARAVKMHPALTGGKGIEALDVVRHGVGLRPSREGGVRLEREVISGVSVVHNYGHAGWGYQGSYGCAEKVVELVDEILTEKGLGEVKV